MLCALPQCESWARCAVLCHLVPWAWTSAAAGDISSVAQHESLAISCQASASLAEVAVPFWLPGSEGLPFLSFSSLSHPRIQICSSSLLAVVLKSDCSHFVPAVRHLSPYLNAEFPSLRQSLCTSVR